MNVGVGVGVAVGVGVDVGVGVGVLVGVGVDVAVGVGDAVGVDVTVGVGVAVGVGVDVGVGDGVGSVKETFAVTVNIDPAYSKTKVISSESVSGAFGAVYMAVVLPISITVPRSEDHTLSIDEGIVVISDPAPS